MASIKYLGLTLEGVSGLYDLQENEIATISIAEPVKKKYHLKTNNQFYTLTLSISSLNVDRRIGQHCKAEAQLIISVANYDYEEKKPSVKDIVRCFESCRASIVACECVDNANNNEVKVSNLFAVAEKYYVVDRTTECQVRTVKNNIFGQESAAESSKTLKVSLGLTLASWDYFMDRTPYSKVYLKKRLGVEVMREMVDAYNSKFDTDWEVEHVGVQNIKYDEPYQDVKAPETTKYHYRELLQPYLVQFNESEYQFLLRNANRCGEFLFFENGKLNFGLKKMTDGITDVNKDLDCYVSMKSSGSTDSFRHDVNYYFHNGNNYGDFRTEGSNTKDRPYVVEYANDDYFRPFKKDDYDNYYEHLSGDENVNVNGLTCHGDFTKEITKHYLWKALIAILAHQDTWGTLMSDIWELITPLRGLTGLLGHGLDYTIAEEINNEDFTSRYFNDTDNIDDCLKPQYAENGQYYSQFSEIYTDEVLHDKFGNEDKTYNNMSNTNIKVSARPSTDLFYRMQELEKESERCQYEVTYDDVVNVALGDILAMESISDDEFVVVDIKCRSGLNNGVWTNQTVVTLLPGQNGKFYPLPAGIEPIRKSDPQTALVADNKDPLFLGRVRIKYMWQNEEGVSEGASPWIRVVYPFATTGSGIYSKLHVGDEVMVNYENGNIELPYVSGSLYSQDNRIPFNTRIYSQVIRSRNGQMIGITEGFKNYELLSGLMPVLPYVLPAIASIPGVDINLTPDDDTFAKTLLGGIVIRDTYGICQIKTSSDDRKVSISSPFGTVVIDAFTGITLSAPNGDINIKGKNVNIVANNNLTLKSGENIEKVFFATSSSKRYQDQSSDRGFIDTALRAAVELGLEYVDMPNVRAIIETFIRPVDGTLTIKSNRYLLLNSGGGNATIPVSAYSKTKKGMDKFDKLYNVVLRYLDSYEFCIYAMADYYHKMYQLRQTQKNRFLDYAAARWYNKGSHHQHYKIHKAFVDEFMKDENKKLKDNLSEVLDKVIDDYITGARSIDGDFQKYFYSGTKDRLEYLKNEYQKFWTMGDDTYCFHEVSGYTRPIRPKSYKDYKTPSQKAKDKRKSFMDIAKILIVSNPDNNLKLFKVKEEKQFLRPLLLNKDINKEDLAKCLRECVSSAASDSNLNNQSDKEWTKSVTGLMNEYRDNMKEIQKKDYGVAGFGRFLKSSTRNILGVGKVIDSISAKHSWRKDARGQILFSEKVDTTKSFNGTEMIEFGNTEAGQLTSILLNPPFTTKNMLGENDDTMALNEISDDLKQLKDTTQSLRTSIDKINKDELEKIFKDFVDNDASVKAVRDLLDDGK